MCGVRPRSQSRGLRPTSHASARCILACRVYAGYAAHEEALLIRYEEPRVEDFATQLGENAGRWQELRHRYTQLEIQLENLRAE